MKFTPATEEELAKANLLEKGKYDFEVLNAEDAVSKKSGAEMIKLKLRVFDNKGGERHIFDYLLPSVPWKLRNFCEAVGLEDRYDAGELTSHDCIGRAAKVVIGVDDKSKEFPPKNVARDYSVVRVGNGASEPEGDEIPF